MVGHSGSRVSSASPGSTPTTRTTTSSSPPYSFFADARRKRSHQNAFHGEENENKLSLREFQELNVASARTPAPPLFTQSVPGSFSSPVI